MAARKKAGEKCLDCGETVEKGARYCPVCGSPTKINLTSDADLRRSYKDQTMKEGRSKMIWILISFLLLILLVLSILYISKMISSQMDKIGSEFY